MFQNLTTSKVKTVSDTILENIIDLWIVSLNQLLAEMLFCHIIMASPLLKCGKLKYL